LDLMPRSLLRGSSLEKAGIAGKLLVYLWEHELCWSMPMVSLLMIFGMLMVFGQGRAIAPFTYTLS